MTMPEEIALTLTMENETIILNLTRNANIPSDVPVIVAENGLQTTWKPNSSQVCISLHTSFQYVMPAWTYYLRWIYVARCY